MTIYLAKVINEETGLCTLGVGSDEDYYTEQGFTKQDVQQSDVDFNWYLTEKCPMLTDTEKQEQEQEQKIGRAHV